VHKQVDPISEVIHVPLLKHGLIEQKLIAPLHVDPVYAGGH
jgi:hypothetical protein